MPEQQPTVTGIQTLDGDDAINSGGEIREAPFFEGEVTIIGYAEDQGGEIKQRKSDGKPFTTPPQFTYGVRIDEERQGQGETSRNIFVGMFKNSEGGLSIREDSKDAFFIHSLELHGVGRDPGAAVHSFTNWSDLLGLRFNMEIKDVQNGRGRTMPFTNLCTGILGFDNEVREANGLEAVTLDV